MRPRKKFRKFFRRSFFESICSTSRRGERAERRKFGWSGALKQAKCAGFNVASRPLREKSRKGAEENGGRRLKIVDCAAANLSLVLRRSLGSTLQVGRLSLIDPTPRNPRSRFSEQEIKNEPPPGRKKKNGKVSFAQETKKSRLGVPNRPNIS